MGAVRRILLGAGLVLALSACTAEHVASSFRGWCKSAPNCDDHTKPPRP